MKTPVVTSDSDDAHIKNALLLYIQSIKRQRDKHPSGSVLFKAFNDSVLEIQSVLTRFGG